MKIYFICKCHKYFNQAPTSGQLDSFEPANKAAVAIPAHLHVTICLVRLKQFLKNNFQWISNKDQDSWLLFKKSDNLVSLAPVCARQSQPLESPCPPGLSQKPVRVVFPTLPALADICI